MSLFNLFMTLKAKRLDVSHLFAYISQLKLQGLWDYGLFRSNRDRMGQGQPVSMQTSVNISTTQYVDTFDKASVLLFPPTLLVILVHLNVLILKMTPLNPKWMLKLLSGWG